MQDTSTDPVVVLSEISWGDFLKKYTPKKNPTTQSIIYPDILRYNPEYCTKEAKRNKVWSVQHKDNDIYAIPGLHHQNNLGLIFTKVPFTNPNEALFL